MLISVDIYLTSFEKIIDKLKEIVNSTHIILLKLSTYEKLYITEKKTVPHSTKFF